MIRRPADWYRGVAVGGPRKGTQVASPDPVYEMCQMRRSPQWARVDPDWVPWVESDRGRYEFEAGHWWWKGWNKEELT